MFAIPSNATISNIINNLSSNIALANSSKVQDQLSNNLKQYILLSNNFSGSNSKSLGDLVESYRQALMIWFSELEYELIIEISVLFQLFLVKQYQQQEFHLLQME